MQYTIKITLEDSNTCGRDCPFLEEDTCLLFHSDLNDTVLPANFQWQDGQIPTKQRHHRCFLITG